MHSFFWSLYNLELTKSYHHNSGREGCWEHKSVILVESRGLPDRGMSEEKAGNRDSCLSFLQEGNLGSKGTNAESSIILEMDAIYFAELPKQCSFLFWDFLQIIMSFHFSLMYKFQTRVLEDVRKELSIVTFEKFPYPKSSFWHPCFPHLPHAMYGHSCKFYFLNMSWIIPLLSTLTLPP